METSTSYQTNIATFYNYLKGYFYKDKYGSYNFVVVEYDNRKLDINERNNLRVSIDFIPEEFIEYEFDIVEATSSYLHLRNFGNNYYLVINQETPLESKTDTEQTQFDYNYGEILDTQEFESDNDFYCYSDDEADGYDSEGYYFRPR